MSFSYDRALELLERAREVGRLAHAYLLMGPPGSGKEKIALRLIEMANPPREGKGAARLEDLRSSLVAIVSPELKSRRISVEAIRGLEHTLQMAAPQGATKFAVIREADRMGPEASNAFLKTLEEPPPASRILLLTSRPEMLLDTILSRCIRVPLSGSLFPKTIDEGLRAFLNALAEHALQKRKGLPSALALMGAYQTLLKEEKESVEKANKDAEKAEIEQYKKTTDGAYLKQREDYWAAAAAAEYLDRRNRLLEYLVAWFGDALRHQQGGQDFDLPDYLEATAALARQHCLEELCRRLRAIESLREHLGTNVNESLALEVAFLDAFA